MTVEQRRIGRVSLVGAGPGDPDLLTVRAWRCLQQAEVLLFDALVDERIIELCSPTCRRVDVGKRPGGRRWPQAAINARLLAEAQAGWRVVRLKGGDPFVFGRGGEEALFLGANGVRYDVVPGISSAIAAPSAAGIPVTHRGVSTHFTVVTGASADDGGALSERWSVLAKGGGTLVFLMPMRNLERIIDALLAGGLAVTCPAALVRAGTRPEQEVVDGSLGTIAARAREVGLRSPATLIVGDVVALRGMIQANQIPLSSLPPGHRTMTQTIHHAPSVS